MAKAVTDEFGTASFEGMYLGKYELLETQTAEGYVRKTEPTAFSLAYVDGYTSPVSAVAGDINITNPRQKVKVNVAKKDVDTGESLEGAVIGPVSYTHLDVYKRQVYYHTNQGGNWIRIK